MFSAGRATGLSRLGQQWARANQVQRAQLRSTTIASIFPDCNDRHKDACMVFTFVQHF
jgi:hypothetical protein